MRKKSPLVCQHLEMISRKAVEQYQDVLKEFVHRRHGIYALYRKDRLYYVGLAGNLRSRLSRHLRDRHAKTWDRFSIYLTIDSDPIRELEALAIRIAMPKGNHQKGRLKKSLDLSRRFRRQVTDRWKTEVNMLFGTTGPKGVPIRRYSKPEGGRKPTLSEYIRHGLKLRWLFKNREYHAYVKRNGAIRFRGRQYTSPSLAATAVTHRPMNGWRQWKFERAPGDWVFLDELRK